jgi:hypothetical protein
MIHERRKKKKRKEKMTPWPSCCNIKKKKKKNERRKKVSWREKKKKEEKKKQKKKERNLVCLGLCYFGALFEFLLKWQFVSGVCKRGVLQMDLIHKLLLFRPSFQNLPLQEPGSAKLKSSIEILTHSYADKLCNSLVGVKAYIYIYIYI